MIAVIRLRGSVKMRTTSENALRSMSLTRVNHCVVLPDSDSFKGMANRVKDFVAYGSVNDEVLLKMIVKRARKSGDIRLTEEEAKSVLKGLKEGKKMKDLGIKPIFRLKPAKKGLKSIKWQFPRGDLGDRRDDINALLERMI